MHMPNTHKRMEIEKMLLNVFKLNPINHLWYRNFEKKSHTRPYPAAECRRILTNVPNKIILAQMIVMMKTFYITLCILIMDEQRPRQVAALFLASFPDGAQRVSTQIRANHHHRNLSLPCPAWFREKLGFDEKLLWRLQTNSENITAASSTLSISSLMMVSNKGCTYTSDSGDGIMQRPLHRESEVQRIYHNIDPLDSYDVRIEEVHKLRASTPLHGSSNSRRSTDGFQRIQLVCPLFVPYWTHDAEAAELKLNRQACDAEYEPDGPSDSDKDNIFDDVEREPGEDFNDVEHQDHQDQDAAEENNTTVAQKLVHWALPVEPHSIGCMVLPLPIVKLIEAGQWERILIMIRWHGGFQYNELHGFRYHLEGPIQSWPPVGAATWDNAGKNRSTGPANDDKEFALTADVCRVLADNLNDVAPTIAADDTARQKMMHVQKTLLFWYQQLLAGHKLVSTFTARQIGRFKYDTRTLLQTIKLAMMLKGGGNQVANVVAKSLSTVLPACAQHEFLEMVSRPGDELLDIKLDKDADKIPAASLVRRYELALDMALMKLARKRCLSIRSVRAFLADSSPIGGHDWIWSMYFEVQDSAMIEVFFACTNLILAIQAYAESIALELEENETFSREQCCYVAPEWEPWLKTLLYKVHLHINHPNALATGHQGQADKVAAEVYKMHFQTPNDIRLKDEATRFRWNTADMGIELGLATHELANGDPASLLPPWVERGESQLDANFDIENEDNHADNDLAFDDVENEDEHEPPAEEVNPAPAPAPPAVSNQFMPNAYTFAGVQHVTNNANADADKSMPHFKPWYENLKVVESLLGQGYRRERYQWTCLRKTQYEHHSNMFNHFDGSLYEARWHETVTFRRKSDRLIIVLVLTFNARKYNSGLDVDGAALATESETAKTRARREQSHGIAHFDAVKLEAILKSGDFHTYSNMVGVVDDIPTAFAKDLELCPCHKALYKKMNSYQIQCSLCSHYSGWIKSCPMSGKVIPELVAGGLDETLDDLKTRSEVVVQAYVAPRGTTPVTQAQWGIIIGDFRQGARANFTIITLKYDFIKRLPILAASLAVADEDRARVWGFKVRDAWRADPRPEAHDPRTVRLMGPDAVFAHELDKFLDLGIPREQLNYEFKFELGVFRIGMATETCIEQRHAISTLELRRHFCGPVRISLGSRLPMTERHIRLGAVSGLDLLQEFTECCQLLKAPSAFGVEMHPHAVGQHSPASMRVALAKIIYRCDLFDMYRSQAASKKYNESAKRSKQTRDAKLLAKEAPKSNLNYDIVIKTAMGDHVSARMENGSGGVFSAKACCVNLRQLSVVLDEPMTKKARRELAPADDAGDDFEVEDEGSSREVFFEVVWKNIGRKKGVPVAVGAGQRLRDSDHAVAVHESRLIDGGVALSSGWNPEASFIYSGLVEDSSIADLQEGMKCWSETGRWIMEALAGRDNTELLSKTLEKMIDADALPGRFNARSYHTKSAGELANLHMSDIICR